MGIIQHINGLRGLAVIFVVLYHFFPSLLPGGYIGVDVFFVISGYLITKVIIQAEEDQRFCFRDFYQKRILRLFPGLSLIFLSLIVLGALVMTPSELALLGKQVQAGVLFASNFFYWSQEGYFDSTAIQKPLLHLWSLAVEEQFYLLWPAVIVLAFRLRLKSLSICAGIIVVSLATNLWLIHQHPSFVFYCSLTRFWELALGGALALIHWRNKEPFFFKLDALKGFNFFSDVALIILILVAFFYHDHLLYPGSYAIVPVLMAAMLLSSRQSSNVVLNAKPLCHIGQLSYSIYLWHWPLLSVVTLLVNHPLGWAQKIVLLVLTYGLAFFSHHYWEQILRFHPKRWQVIRRLLLLMLIFVGIGFGFSHSHGWPQRSHMAFLQDNAENFKRTPPRDEACDHFLRKEPHHFYYCRKSLSQREPIVALIGDSHAHAAYPGLVQALEKKGYSALLMANSSCPMTLGYPIKGKTEEEDAECQNHMQEIVDVLAAHKEIETVIVMTRGPIYWTGRAPAFGSDVLHSKHLTPMQWQQGLIAMFNAVQLPTRRVFYVVENPELNQRSEQCQAIPFRQQAKRCVLPKNQVLVRQETYKNLLLAFAGVTVLDTTDLFCPQEHCLWLSPRGASYYSDDNHLSIAGSVLLADHIVPQLALPLKSP